VADDEERYVAREIELSHPDWMVLWGCYSRLFWAFPRFQVPRGTIVSAPIRDWLVADMRSVEAEFMHSPAEFRHSPHAPGYSSPAPAAPLPRRVPLAQRQGQQQQGVPAADFSSAGASLQQDTDSYYLHVPDLGREHRDDEIDPWPPVGVPGQAPPWPPQSSYDPYVSGAIGSGGGDLQWADAHDDDLNPFAPDGTIHS
jgi:hypothetical protein